MKNNCSFCIAVCIFPRLYIYNVHLNPLNKNDKTIKFRSPFIYKIFLVNFIVMRLDKIKADC